VRKRKKKNITRDRQNAKDVDATQYQIETTTIQIDGKQCLNSELIVPIEENSVAHLQRL
jgi:hypothetical protein